MLGLQIVLRAAPAEQARRIGDQYLLLVLGRLALAQNQDARGEPGAVEKVGRQADHRLDQIHLQQLLADVAFHTFAEQGALGQYHGHPTADVGHRLDHVLHPREVTAG